MLLLLLSSNNFFLRWIVPLQNTIAKLVSLWKNCFFVLTDTFNLLSVLGYIKETTCARNRTSHAFMYELTKEWLQYLIQQKSFQISIHTSVKSFNELFLYMTETTYINYKLQFIQNQRMKLYFIILNKRQTVSSQESASLLCVALTCLSAFSPQMQHRKYATNAPDSGAIHRAACVNEAVGVRVGGEEHLSWF